MTSLPRTAADIMTKDLITLRKTDSIATAREKMATHQIRHVPVVDDDDYFVGVVTQKAMLGEALRVADRFGLQDLEHQARKHTIEALLGTDVETIQPQLPLLEAGRFFLNCKHGCLPVLEDGKLVGVLTSSDFVRLSVSLLEAQSEESSG